MNNGFYFSQQWRVLAARVRKKWLAQGKACPWCGLPFMWGDKTIVDHTLSINDRPDLRMVETNLVLMHHKCHSQKTVFRDKQRRPELDMQGYPDKWQ